MSNVNRGKQFEDQVQKGFERVPETSVDRLYDPQGGYAGVSNICDFVVYHYPRQYYVECKSTYENTLSIYSNNPKRKYGALSNTQWEGLLKKSDIVGVTAGVIVWFINHDMTIFVPIKALAKIRDFGAKSLNINKLGQLDYEFYIIPGIKRRILFDYDFSGFLGE